MDSIQQIEETQEIKASQGEEEKIPSRILVVDDESDLEILFRQMFRREIRKKELTFDFVHNGQEALDRLVEDSDYNMVLSDIRMPHMDGLTLLSNLNKKYPLLKAVMVTAYGDMENIRKAMNGGAFDFISKPIQYQDLKKTIDKTLNHVAELRELHRARQEKEEAQARMVAELQKLNKLKDEFLANTSHELRTPLNGIIGIVESLVENSGEPLPEKTAHNLNLVLQSGKRLATLVNDILDFAKLKNETYSLREKALNVSNFVDLGLTLSEPLARGKDIRLINEIPEDAPTVKADPDRLQQILLNLIGNAVKFTEEGYVRVAAEKKDDRLEIQVADTGIGISEDKQESIFEAFQQAEGSSTRNFGGTGLGLSITRKLVELHGGKIEVNSVQGKGSTFSFSLPITNETAEESINLVPKLDLSLQDTEPQTSSLDDRKPIHGHYRILVVDDNPVNLQVLVNHLQDYEIVMANNGMDALDHVLGDGEEHHFDLVLLDVMMPGMNGYEVCKKIRQTYKSTELPVLLLTAKNQTEDLVTGLEAGANDFITKPFTMKELLARVKTHLRLGRLTQELKNAQIAALENARAAGKADFATTVLHNVGNILSSIKVSCTQATSKLNSSKISGFLIAARMIDENLQDIARFFTQDEKGSRLPTYFVKLADILKKENEMLLDEMTSMQKRLFYMEKAIQVQQTDAKDEMIALRLEDLIEESLTVQASSLKKYGVEVFKEFKYHKPIIAQRTELIHTLVNLIKNSIEAMYKSDERVLSIETGEKEDGRPYCKIADTGEGVADLSKLFKFGETTKEGGHGFGLHSCLKSMENMKGSLEAESEGVGKGATFTLTFHAEQNPLQ